MTTTPQHTPTPYTYGRGTRLSAAFTKGRDGLPMPAEAREPTSAARKAWEAGRAEYLATLAPHPHPGGCECCRDRRVCNACGEPLGRDRCTNGRCAKCHARHCTSGGETSPGHGYGTVG